MLEGEIVKRRLKERGFDVELLSSSPVISQLPQPNRVIYVCKDSKGNVGLLSVPETALHFEGIVYRVDNVMILIEKKVASDWGLL